MGRRKYVDPDGICVATGKVGVTLHHLMSRGSGGGDEEWNLLPISQPVHQQIHTIGLSRSCEMWPGIRRWLREHDWEFDPVLGKWRHKK